LQTTVADHDARHTNALGLNGLCGKNMHSKLFVELAGVFEGADGDTQMIEGEHGTSDAGGRLIVACA